MSEIFGLDVEVFAPCALGAILDDTTLSQMKAKVVAGAANNQLAHREHDRVLMHRDILYAPDYVINAGGIIDIYYEGPGYDWAKVEKHLQQIGQTLSTIYARSRAENRPTGEIADRMAEERFKA